jgi:hypothetical protein
MTLGWSVRTNISADMLHVRKEEDGVRGVHAEVTRRRRGVPATRAALSCCPAWPSREAFRAEPDVGREVYTVAVPFSIL